MSKTYAPVGLSPVLGHKLSRDHLSVIGAVTPEGKLYFQMQERNVTTAGIIGFLQHQQQQIPGKLLLIWDGTSIHRSRALQAYLSTCEPGRLQLAMLPGYAPELNPEEGIWRYLKYTELKNLACQDLLHLKQELVKAIKRLRHKVKVIRACFTLAEGCLQT